MILPSDIREGMKVLLLEEEKKIDEGIIEYFGDGPDFQTKQITFESLILFPGQKSEFAFLYDRKLDANTWTLIFEDPFVIGKRCFSHNSPSYTLERAK